MDISPEARTVLLILNSLKLREAISTLDAIQNHDDWKKQGKDDLSLHEVLDQLIDRELVSCEGDMYLMTKGGALQAKKFFSEGFSDHLVSIEQSVTSRKFCKQVYGLDLCQLNMTSQAQLDKLLEVMNLSEDDHLLDMGCGVGLISEYISDVTGASVMGIDFAEKAVERAQERTQAKRDRISYQVMDMDELSFPEQSFSGVISIDTLYFVNDLKGTIQSAKKCLQEGGRMGIFYSTMITAEETLDKLAPQQTTLAKALKDCGLNYQIWDFTQEEREIWEKILCVAEELKQEYGAEGCLDLYEGTVSEAKYILEFTRTGRSSRYLYHIQ